MSQLGFEYIHKPSAKNVNISARIGSDGKLIVTSPKFIPKFIIEKFLLSKKSWIITQLAAAQKKTHQLNNEKWVFVFGKKYLKTPSDNNLFPLGVSISGNKIIINPASDSGQESSTQNQQKTLDRFLKNTAQKFILPRTHLLAQKMKTKFNRITLKKQKTRWGSCSSQGNLNFNWQLVHFPTSVIDYVIIHELAHRTHLNHSTKFWDLVKKYDPNFKINQGWLKRRGFELG